MVSVGDRHVVLDVGEAVALRLDDLALANDGDRHAGNALRFHLVAHDGVDRIGLAPGHLSEAESHQEDDGDAACHITP